MPTPAHTVAVRSALVLSALSAFLVTPLPARSQNADAPASVRLFDDFSGKLGLNWKPIRHDPTHVSLSTRDRMLTIRTQRGTIHRDSKAQGWPEAKNLFLIENPLPPDATFQITTRLDRFRPTELFQQAGLLLYNDDDHYLKWIVQFNHTAGVGQVYSLMTEIAAVSEFQHYPAPDDGDELWLRITKRGNHYTVSGSATGKDFQDLETREWPVEGPIRIGLVAKNGGGLQDTPELDAHFDFFELKSPLDDLP